MITYKSRFLTRAEVWYDDQPEVSQAVDWILYQQRSQPVPGLRAKSFYTSLIDLAQSEEQLLANLNRDTAYKIRRARERDGIICHCCNPLEPGVMDRFEEFFNLFAALKGRSPLNRTRFESMAAAGVLDLSVAKDHRGIALVYHANHRDRHRATSLELPSLYRKYSDRSERNFISRANRYLTWSDILRYKERGLKYFDFGGWYPGSSDAARLEINRFKAGFGGRIVQEYNCEQIRSIKGWVVLAASGVLTGARAVAGKLRSATKPREFETSSCTASSSLSHEAQKAATRPELKPTN